MISVTLQFNDFAAAAHALMRIASPEQFAATVSAQPGATVIDYARSAEAGTPVVIAPADRPDTGAALPPAPALPDPAAAAFGGAVAQAAPLISGSANLNPMVAALNAPPHVPVAPPTPPAAPSAPSAATGPIAAPAVERDSTGLPWDARIHASTKTKTKEGVWTAKRNTPPELKAQVEADLRGVPAPQAAAAANPLASMPAPSTGALVPPTLPATPPVAPPAPPAGAAPTFAEYMAKVGEYFSNQPLKAMEAMTAALRPHGMEHVGQLAGKPELIPAVDAEFRRLLG